MIYLLTIAYFGVLGLQSSAATLIGNQIGNANIIQAKEYFKVCCYFLFIVIVAEALVFYSYEKEIIDIFTKDKSLVDKIHSNYYMILICFVPELSRGMLKGPLRSLGLQNRAIYFNLIFQGIVMMVLIIYFGFLNDDTSGLIGIWIANTITGMLISLS